MKHLIIVLSVFIAVPVLSGSHAKQIEKVVASGKDDGLKIEANVAFTEGPAWHAPSKSVFFTDLFNSRILRRDAVGAIHTYRIQSNRTNGLAFDRLYRLVACESANTRRITRTELDGTITVLADNYKGFRFNSPNDLAIDSRGRIYFTDPRYGSREDMQILADDGTAIEGVYRIDGDGLVHQVLGLEVQRPNGIALSDDERHLFIADHASGRANGNRVLWRFDLGSDGSVDRSSQTSLFDWGNSGSDRGPDGMCIGPDGRLYVTAGLNFSDSPEMVSMKYPAGVYVIDPGGEGLLDFIPCPTDVITNCTFGGDTGSTLFITAGHRLFSVEIE